MRGELIKGGYILMARKIERSGIMDKPPLYTKLWIWMLLKASFKDHGDLKRGQFFSSLMMMQDAMSYKVGYRQMKPTIKEIRTATKFLTKSHMIVTTKVTHGILITILNYGYYQDFKNYEGHSEGHDEGHTEGTILRTKDRKKGNTPAEISEKILNLKTRYQDQGIIDQALSAISSTRKSNRLADSVILGILRSWDRYSVEAVISGIQVYLQKDYAGQGKQEAYLLAIIRNQGQEAGRPIGQSARSTGSALLDRYYQEQEASR